MSFVKFLLTAWRSHSDSVHLLANSPLNTRTACCETNPHDKQPSPRQGSAPSRSVASSEARVGISLNESMTKNRLCSHAGHDQSGEIRRSNISRAASREGLHKGEVILPSSVAAWFTKAGLQFRPAKAVCATPNCRRVWNALKTGGSNA